MVDFIGPIDLGVMLWPIFNIADMAISCGAVMLAVSFWREDRDERLAAVALSEGDPSGEEHAGDSDPVSQPRPESTA